MQYITNISLGRGFVTSIAIFQRPTRYMASFSEVIYLIGFEELRFYLVFRTALIHLGHHMLLAASFVSLYQTIQLITCAHISRLGRVRVA